MSADPLKQSAAFDMSLDELGNKKAAFDKSAEGQKAAADAKREAAKAEREAKAAERREAAEAKIAATAAAQECTVTVRLERQTLEEAMKTVLAKLGGTDADSLASFKQTQFGSFTVQYASKEQAEQAKAAAPKGGDGVVLKGKDVTGALKISTVKGVAIPSRTIHFLNPIRMPERRVPRLAREKPAEGEDAKETDEAREARIQAAREARAAAQAQSNQLYDAFKDDLIAKVSTLFSAPGGGEGDDDVAEIQEITLRDNFFCITFASRASVLKAKAGFFEPLVIERSKVGPIRMGFPKSNSGKAKAKAGAGASASAGASQRNRSNSKGGQQQGQKRNRSNSKGGQQQSLGKRDRNNNRPRSNSKGRQQQNRQQQNRQQGQQRRQQNNNSNKRRRRR